MIYSAKKIYTHPLNEPLTLAKAKEFLRVTHNDDNALITDIIKSVRTTAENLMDSAIVTQTWQAFYSDWPSDYFILPMAPLQTITHIKYKNTAGTLSSAISSSLYIVDANSYPGRVSLGYDQSWPTTELYPVNPIEIQFVCGYTEVPEDIITMLKIGVERLYDRPDENYDKLLGNVWALFLRNYKTYKG